MAQETNQSQAPLLCSTDCGFYSSPRNNGPSSVDSSVGGSALTQSSVSIAITSLAARSCSGPTTASVTSTEGSTSGAKSSLTADYVQSSGMSGRAADVGGTQEGQCLAGSSATVSTNSYHSSKKRKLEDPHDNVVVQRASGSEESVNAALETEEKPKAKKSRCFTCRKKLGLTGFQCRCGNAFCSMHRYSDTHNCTFDYRANAAEKLREENPIVVAEKIQKI
ncbi:AN1-type zinc finger protein 6 isoform X2 [Scophthalmus maximus]|uniref:AN1-type zinc finger protein 6 isoform X2 n=1 Tax=Scophthalmus maximus TaxID=52904 RepID=UPI0015E15061|nr:AN1-type zinc finger protein 6 isoform X2 [Scophthalmus maximus]